MPPVSRRYFLKRVGEVGTGAATTALALYSLALQGCQGDSIIKQAKGIIADDERRNKAIREAEQRLFSEYKAMPQRVYEPYQAREELPVWKEYGNDISTLFYRVAYGDIEAIAKGITTHFAQDTKTAGYPIISPYNSSDRLIISVNNPVLKRRLEDQLYILDRAPRHVRLRVSIYGVLADVAQDFNSQFQMLLQSQGKNPANLSATADFPGSELRVPTRNDMSNRWGAQLEMQDFTVQGYVDWMKSHGVFQRFYDREMTLADKKRFLVDKNEKLPVTAIIQNGLQTIVTDNLVDVINSMEITPSIHDGLVEVTFNAKVGNAKRPDVKRNILLPQQEDIEMNGIYLKLGEIYAATGIVENMKIKRVRRGFLFPWPSGEDSQQTVASLLCTVTPQQVVIYDPDTLVWPFEGQNPFPRKMGSSDPLNYLKQMLRALILD
jgi:hypothetical protein